MDYSFQENFGADSSLNLLPMQFKLSPFALYCKQINRLTRKLCFQHLQPNLLQLLLVIMTFLSDENIKKHDSNWNTEPDSIFLGMFTSFYKGNISCNYGGFNPGVRIHRKYTPVL